VLAQPSLAVGHLDRRLARLSRSVRFLGLLHPTDKARHFGRAAAALRLAQSYLSRQVRRLEQDLGAWLFDRTPQGTELTEAGEVFLPRARALLRSAAQAAAAASSRIVIGHTTGIIVTPPVLKLSQRHHDADVRVLHLAWDEPRRAPLDHRADAVICRLPLETRGLHVAILYD
jgi:DNA-binding transcriptional LysR family regulator